MRRMTRCLEEPKEFNVHNSKQSYHQGTLQHCTREVILQGLRWTFGPRVISRFVVGVMKQRKLILILPRWGQGMYPFCCN
jgi:hypothetical protein